MVNILEFMHIHVNYCGDLLIFFLNFIKVEIQLKHRKLYITVSVQLKRFPPVNPAVCALHSKKKGTSPTPGTRLDPFQWLLTLQGK